MRKRPLRVLHLVPALFGPTGIVGGAERYSLELARHMAERVDARLVTFGEQRDETHVGRLSLRVIDRAWYVRGQRTNPMAAGIVPEVLHADVVHCHQQHVLMSSAAAVTARVSGRRVFATDLGGGGWDVSGYVSTDRWFTGHLHISEYSRQVFGHADKPWARVILGGVDTKRFSPDAASARTKAAMFVGRLLPHKGISDLIGALPAGMALDVVGPPQSPDYLAELKRDAQGKNVSFLHNLSDTELVRAYRRALCVVLPSVYRASDGSETKVPELLGQTLLEAMACGTPVICTRVASMPEIVEDGVSGFIVPPGDRIALADRLRWFETHPAQTEEMGAAGRRAVLARFQWSQVVDRCLDAYQQ